MNKEQLNTYIELDKEAKEKGFKNYLDKREFDINSPEEREELNIIQSILDAYYHNQNMLTPEEFLEKLKNNFKEE